MSDLTFDYAMERQFVFYNVENTYAAGPKIVQKYRGMANFTPTDLGWVDEQPNG